VLALRMGSFSQMRNSTMSGECLSAHGELDDRCAVKSFRSATLQLCPSYSGGCIVLPLHTDADLDNWITELSGPDESRSHEWDCMTCPNDPTIFIHRWTSALPTRQVRALIAVEFAPFLVQSQPHHDPTPDGETVSFWPQIVPASAPLESDSGVRYFIEELLTNLVLILKIASFLLVVLIAFALFGGK
jgi:hypothetical protein